MREKNLNTRYRAYKKQSTWLLYPNDCQKNLISLGSGSKRIGLKKKQLEEESNRQNHGIN